MDKVISTARDLLVSRTIWGAVILLANGAFGKNIDPGLGEQAPAVFSALLDAIGATMILIGRILAKPTAIAQA